MPQQPKGRLYRLRTYFSYFYLILFFCLPFISLEGEPLFLFNVLERKFILFGKIFWPEIFHICNWLSYLFSVCYFIYGCIWEVVSGSVYPKPFFWKWFPENLNIG
jgi:polyferredoxin